MNNRIRLNKFLSTYGVCSRRKADEHILLGKVFVNDKKAKLGDFVDLKKDVIKYYGKIIKPNQEKIYFALYKPVGYVTTSKSQKNEKNILSLIKTSVRIYPVGRLDKESEGLLILTNDGELTKELTHPSFLNEKEYWIYAEDESKILSPKRLQNKFERGININNKFMKADKVYDIEKSGNRYRFKLVLHTGYNRQIRKMSAIMKLRICKIIRTRINKLNIEELKIKTGEYKKIKIKDII